MAIPMNALSQTIEALLRTQARRATKYISERETVKVTRRHHPTKRDTMTELLLTFGTPNYAERQFIKACKKAGEPFPVKKIQLKFPPKKRK